MCACVCDYVCVCACVNVCACFKAIMMLYVHIVCVMCYWHHVPKIISRLCLNPALTSLG